MSSGSELRAFEFKAKALEPGTASSWKASSLSYPQSRKHRMFLTVSLESWKPWVWVCTAVLRLRLVGCRISGLWEESPKQVLDIYAIHGPRITEDKTPAPTPRFKTPRSQCKDKCNLQRATLRFNLIILLQHQHLDLKPEMKQ